MNNMGSNILRKLSFMILFIVLIQTNWLYSQENTEDAPEVELEETLAEGESAVPKVKGRFNFFINNNMIFLLSVDDGFGFGETLNIQYTTPFNLAFGLEAGYYGAKSEVYPDGGGTIVGGFSLIPLYAVAEYNFRIIENLYISPVVKFGGAYTRARISGWYGGSAFSMVFEGGVRLKAVLSGGLLIHGNICYGGLIESSGIFSMINVGFGLGF